MRFFGWRLRLAMALVTIASLGWPATTTAQSSATGTLKGVVSDSTGSVVPGATVLALNRQTGFSQRAITGAAGDWAIPTLPTGSYDVSVELPGFKTTTRPEVLVEAAVARQVDLRLEVGGVGEQITVTVDMPLVVTTSATTYRRLNSDELTQIPTSTRSFTHLLSAEAGVSADLPPDPRQRHRQHLPVGER